VGARRRGAADELPGEAEAPQLGRGEGLLKAGEQHVLLVAHVVVKQCESAFEEFIAVGVAALA
jgi:hypothetical protein